MVLWVGRWDKPTPHPEEVSFGISRVDLALWLPLRGITDGLLSNSCPMQLTFLLLQRHRRPQCRPRDNLQDSPKGQLHWFQSPFLTSSSAVSHGTYSESSGLILNYFQAQLCLVQSSPLRSLPDVPARCVRWFPKGGRTQWQQENRIPCFSFSLWEDRNCYPLVFKRWRTTLLSVVSLEVFSENLLLDPPSPLRLVGGDWTFFKEAFP